MRIERVEGGQSNPTFFLSFDDCELVLRKRPPGKLLPSAHAVDREYRVLTALSKTCVPVPKPLLFHGDADIVGTDFYVMERVPGRVFHDSSLPGVSTAERRSMYESAAETLAALHSLNVETLGLSDFGKQENYYARQLGRWSHQWKLSKTAENPAIEWLIDWLSRHIPATTERVVVIHGDFRIGNLIFHPHVPRVVAILDWELSTLGHPLADLAHCCAFTWHTTPEEYQGVMGLNLEALGLPSERGFCEYYYSAAQYPEKIKKFHVVFALFRNALIFEGIAARAELGNAAASNAARVGRVSRDLAKRAVAIAQPRFQKD
jgi:aminoglycoside phosphotransferase (APT) family kinase protein